MNKKHCAGCRQDFYNGKNTMNIMECWNLKTAKLVKRIRIGNWERPPYLNKKPVKIPACYHESGSDKIHYIKESDITEKGYWK